MSAPAKPRSVSFTAVDPNADAGQPEVDAGTTTDAGSVVDSGVVTPDAGIGTDAGTTVSDAGTTETDAGTTTETDAGTVTQGREGLQELVIGGCGCNGAGAAPFSLLGFVLLVLRARRRSI